MIPAAMILTAGVLALNWASNSGARCRNLVSRSASNKRASQLLVRYFPTLTSKLGWSSARHPHSTVVETPQELLRSICNLVHTGMDPSRAWASLGVLTDGQGLPLRSSLGARVKVCGGSSELTAALAATCVMAHTLGTSLASSLSALEQELDTLQRASAEREVALAGPRTSARILQGLPVVGLGAAYLLGADPLAWFTSEPVGAIVAFAGVACIYWGRKWTSRLIRDALAAQA